jgi:hypothetical protein
VSNFNISKLLRGADVVGQGDSGSWVIDDETGDLYGHVVAGSPESSIAFVMPAQNIRNEIKEVFGYEWRFPQEVASKSQDAFEPGISPQTKQKSRLPATQEIHAAIYTAPTFAQSSQSFVSEASSDGNDETMSTKEKLVLIGSVDLFIR